jgi:membrane protein implicated in regulation of membrane protease activity
MDTLITFLTSLGPQHWLVFGLILLIAEMASGTMYLLWPAVAAFLTALVAWTGATNWAVEIAIFAVLVIALTAFGRPIVKRWREEKNAEGLNERSKMLIGTRGVITVFANGTGSVKIADTVWRAVSDEALAPGQTVVIDAVDGTTLKVRAAAA